MIRPAPHIRYHIAAILAAHWIQFVAQYKRWIRPVVFENVRKVLACRSPVLGCHIYQCGSCGHVELIPHSCKSRFCPTCGKHATDVWADQVLNGLLDIESTRTGGYRCQYASIMGPTSGRVNGHWSVALSQLWPTINFCGYVIRQLAKASGSFWYCR